MEKINFKKRDKIKKELLTVGGFGLLLVSFLIPFKEKPKQINTNGYSFMMS
ncbi:hypothetical protein BMS3Abin17_00049 [archaeon BMS3Abin17]|nr:hypothetical protein BMS3Abin17_00049 [archaeon BMS3Abin17]